MGRLQGKVAIVTGAARGMGEHHARRMVSEGAKVVLTDLSEDSGRQIAQELGDQARFMRQDVASEEDWRKVLSFTEESFGPVDVLINNAGFAAATALEELSVEVLDEFFSVNATSVFLGMKTVVPSMRRAGGGSIVNISSVSGRTGSPGALAYNASKFAVTGMTKAAALDLGKYGIRVNSVHPGLILTPLLLSNAQYIDQLISRVPLGRGGRPDEVSGLVLFLASEDSSYCTGAEFVIDGGLTCQQ